VSNELTDASDMLPTLADIGGAKLPNGIELDGCSLVARMHDHAPPRRWVFAEREKRYFVRNQRWKLYDDGQFFDMERDPDEKRPLSDDSLSSAASAAHNELQHAMNELNIQQSPQE
jgi:arylsulfatase A